MNLGSPNEDFPGPEWEYGRAQYSSGWSLLIHDLCRGPFFHTGPEGPVGPPGIFRLGSTELKVYAPQTKNFRGLNRGSDDPDGPGIQWVDGSFFVTRLV